MKRLLIGKTESGKDFTLSDDIITQSIAILAKRRTGKSYTADVIAEELLKIPQQTVIIDPTGVHWGLRSSATGKQAGFPIVVFGGRHADVPLEEQGGEILARAIIEQKFSAIVDTSLLQKGQTLRFLDGFLKTLYHLNTEPLHLILDEVDYYCPQMTRNPQEAITTSHVDDLVRRGGIKGIGVTMITQRSSVVNKNVLTQCEVLITLRLVHPLDIKAVMEWIGVHASVKQAARMVESLPSLPVGTAWFWWPAEELFECVAVRTRTTFDSGRTPKHGDRLNAPKVLAQVDLERLGEQMKATIERAKASDPRLLRMRIAELEQAAKKSVSPLQPAVKTIKVPVFKDSQIARLESIFSKIVIETERHGKAMALLWGYFNEMGSAFQKALESVARIAISPAQPPKQAVVVPFHKMIDLKKPNGETSDALTNPERRILNAIAWLNSIGVESPEITAVAFLSGYRPNGGAFNNPKGALRSRGLVIYDGKALRLTDTGHALAEIPDTTLTQGELHAKIKSRLPGPESKLFTEIVRCYPGEISLEDLAEKTGYSVGGGAFNNPRGRLRTLGLIEYVNGGVRARDILFP